MRERRFRLEVDFGNEKFDLYPLTGRGELAPQQAKEAIMAASMELLKKGKLDHATYIAADEAKTPQEALLYLMRYSAYGTHDKEKYDRECEERERQLKEREIVAMAEMKEDMQARLRAQVDQLDLGSLDDGSWQQSM